MSLTALSCDELVADFEGTAKRWHDFFHAHPPALAVPCDIAGSTNVAELVWHIFTVSIRHSQRLLGEEISAFDHGRITDLDGLMTLEAEAVSNMRRYLEVATQQNLDEILEFATRTAGIVRMSHRKLLVHIGVHAIRHWAQIGTLVRQHGMKPDWPQDFASSVAME